MDLRLNLKLRLLDKWFYTSGFLVSSSKKLIKIEPRNEIVTELKHDSVDKKRKLPVHAMSVFIQWLFVVPGTGVGVGERTLNKHNPHS